MKLLLDDMERTLTDLFQMGLATAGPEMAARLAALSERCENTGLHTGAALFAEISQLLSERSHQFRKSDLQITAAICRAAQYITLCRTRLTEDAIRAGWQKGGPK